VHTHNIGACDVCTENWKSSEDIFLCMCNVGMQCMHVEYSRHVTV
jgi:hypothetical protein